ncbi:MAG: DUF1566 domain-containing protein [Thermodesulfobacteriota bacterium]
MGLDRFRRLSKLIGLGTTLVIVLQRAMVVAGSVPDTGQTTCYNHKEEIPCPEPGQAYSGQDGSHVDVGWPSYTRLNQNGNPLHEGEAGNWIMTRDNVTHLVWEVKTDDGGIHDKDNTYSWCDTREATNGGDQGACGYGHDTEAFVAALNEARFGGFTDWRLPTREELRSIVDYGADVPAISTAFFPNTSTDYWTSSPFAGYRHSAWLVGGRGDGYDYKSSAFHARAVRSDDPAPASTGLVVNPEGTTVTDTRTGLVWQRNLARDECGRLQTWTWGRALAYCEDPDLAGVGWRLPTVKELASLVDLSRYGPAIDESVFPDTPSTFFWSSTTGAEDPNDAWVVGFQTGATSHDDKSNIYHVRCVRDSVSPASGSRGGRAAAGR